MGLLNYYLVYGVMNESFVGISRIIEYQTVYIESYQYYCLPGNKKAYANKHSHTVNTFINSDNNH